MADDNTFKLWNYQNPVNMEISKDFEIEYGHHLRDYSGDCKNPHGHTGKLKVCIKGPIQPNGMVMDYKELTSIVKKYVITQLDHAYLNNLIYQPTAENILVWIWETLEDNGLENLTRLEFKETSNSTAVLRLEDMQ